jgi:hypothetical protein
MSFLRHPDIDTGLAIDERGRFVEVVYWHGLLYVIEDVRPRGEYL